ncbi:MAG: hypothetical protein ACRC6I_06410 [Paracoccaceae bacterium]
MTDTNRYSDKRLADSFTAYVLLSEPLQFRTNEILEAVREDYPDLVWSDTLGADTAFDTGRFSLGVFFATKSDVPEPGMTRLTSTPGRCEVDWADIVHKSRYTFPDGGAAVAAHRSCLSISLESVDKSYAARFDAARRLACLGAVFAKLPVCLGIYFPSADQLLKPADWVDAADTAMKAEFPALRWVTLAVNAMPDGKEPIPVTVNTSGLAAFTGSEICMPVTRIAPGKAAEWVYAAAVMVTQLGHKFVDGDTMGPEDKPDRLRLRFVPEGKHGMQTDTWMLIHADCTLDEFAMFGDRSRPPPPKGVDNSIRGDAGWLGKRLYAFVAGGRA